MHIKKIKFLSGGERGRVSLAKLMLSGANFLILDEPTNHLDMESKEILENALNRFSGTILYVSHDRYFINRTAKTILELTPNEMVSYMGNYDDYVARKAQRKISFNNEAESFNGEMSSVTSYGFFGGLGAGTVTGGVSTGAVRCSVRHHLLFPTSLPLSSNFPFSCCVAIFSST